MTDIDGVERTFTIYRFPATEGRQLCTQYPMEFLPIVGNYTANESIHQRIMTYASVKIDGVDSNGNAAPFLQPLDSTDLIDEHCGDWEVSQRLVTEILAYNTSFLSDGKGSTFLHLLSEMAKELITQMLTDLSEQS